MDVFHIVVVTNISLNYSVKNETIHFCAYASTTSAKSCFSNHKNFDQIFSNTI